MCPLDPLGTPLLLFFMLFQMRKRFNPPESYNDEARAIQLVEADTDLKNEPIAAYAGIFRPRFWWYAQHSVTNALARPRSPSPALGRPRTPLHALGHPRTP